MTVRFSLQPFFLSWCPEVTRLPCGGPEISWCGLAEVRRAGFRELRVGHHPRGDDSVGGRAWERLDKRGQTGPAWVGRGQGG